MTTLVEELRQDGQIALLKKQLAWKFGTISSEHEAQLEAATAKELARYATRILGVKKIEDVFSVERPEPSLWSDWELVVTQDVVMTIAEHLRREGYAEAFAKSYATSVALRTQVHLASMFGALANEPFVRIRDVFAEELERELKRVLIDDIEEAAARKKAEDSAALALEDTDA